MYVFAVTLGGGQIHPPPYEPALGVHVFVSPAKVAPAGSHKGDPVLPALAFTPLIVIGLVEDTWQDCVV